MFNNLPGQQPEDIFNETDSVPHPKPPTPQPSQPSKPSQPSQLTTVQELEAELTPRKSFPVKLLLFVGVIVLVIGVAAAISSFLLSSQTSSLPPEPSAPSPSAQNVAPPIESEPEPDPSVPPAPIIIPEPPAPESDTDQDGLSDVLEAQNGTDPTNPDTDQDGLSDREEVMIYRTNPLNPDTDGDTFSDGSEVKNGYSPTGPGKLFEVPTQ